MDSLSVGVVVVCLGVGVLILLRRIWAAGLARGAARAGYLDDCKALLTDGLKAIAPTGFPRLSGRWQGQVFDVQAVPDTLTFRKLPALWLLVTLPTPLPLRATVDVMLRPTGVEPFSNFRSLPEQVDLPPGFPEDCAIRSDDAMGMLPEVVLHRHLELFADERIKELVISPKGLRVVWLAQEANRGRYLIFRDAEMGQVPLMPMQLRPLMQALLALQADILAEMAPGESLSA